MRSRFVALASLFLVLVLCFMVIPYQVKGVSSDIVISQVYGGGGNSGATLKNDFIELFNRGTTTVSVTGWSVQYASSAGTTWQRTNLSGSIPPGGYYLVQEAAGAGGTVNLPAPDATGSPAIAMSATSAKVALVNNQTTITAGTSCPSGSSIVDFVGYGSANCFEGSAAPAISNTTADLRANSGCTDTDVNSADFAPGAPSPRNSASPVFNCNAPPPPPPPLTPIHTIQGNGSASPLVSTSVTTTGIVTARKSNGFFLQEPDASVDADPNTSEGIFVFTSSAPPAAAAIGNAVSVSATVSEFIPSSDPHSPPLTELTGAGVTLVSSGNPLPTPVTLTATDTNPGGSIEQLEKYEGMRIFVGSLTVVAPTLGAVNEANATATSNGVFYGVISGVARPFREPGVEVPDPLPAGSPCCVPFFDANPERLRVDSDAQTGSTAIDVTTGATVMNITGVLDYGFRTYTIDPDAATPPLVSGNISATDVPVALDNEFTTASFNMQRFFDTVNDPAKSDSVLTPTAFDNRLNKASLIIRNILHTPDILGVVEMENLTTLQALASRISSDAIAAGQPDPAYAAYLVEGNDIGGIDVGFLVKPGRVTVNSVTQVGAAATFINPLNNLPELLNDRPPLVLEGVVHKFGFKSTAITVIVNHLRSLSGVDDPVDGPRVRAKRQAGAEFLANYIQSRQVADPNERIVAVGDFNAFEFNDGYVDAMGTIKGTPPPVNQVVLASSDLVDPDLINLTDQHPASDRYSFSFDGSAQVLDHILINSNVVSLFNRMQYARVNADFPEIYRSDASRPERLSDHDPEVAYFLLPPNNPPTADAGPDQLISCASLTSNTVTLDGSSTSDLDGDTLAYTWTGPFPQGGGTITGVSPAITLPIGIHTIHLTVDDGNGGTSTDDVVITIPLAVQGLQSPLAALTLDGDPLVYPGTAFRLNRTLPLKLQLFCGSLQLSNSDVSAPQIVGITRGADALEISTMDLDSGQSNDNGVAFRFSDGTWMFNLSTQGWSAGRYFVTIGMPDGRRYNTAFVLR